MRYQQATKIIAWIQFVSSTLCLICTIIGVSLLIQNDPTYMQAIKELYPGVIGDLIINANAGQKLAFSMSGILAGLADMILGRYLFNAAKELNYKKLRNWYIITATETVIMFVISVTAHVAFLGEVNYGIAGILIALAGFGFAGVSLFIVSLLRDEIKRNSLPVKVKVSGMSSEKKKVDNQKPAGNSKQRQGQINKNNGGGIVGNGRGKYQPNKSANDEEKEKLYPALN